MDLGGASEQSRPDRSLQIGQWTCQQPFRHLASRSRQTVISVVTPKTKQETVSYGFEKLPQEAIDYTVLVSSRIVLKGYVMPR